MKIIIFIFSLFILHISYAAPSLIRDCSFSDFTRNRMPIEREQFWQRTDTFEYHDLTAVKMYNQQLLQQILTCYEVLDLQELKECNFNAYQFDPIKIQKFNQSPEYYNWKLSHRLMEKNIHSAKRNYLIKLSHKIKKCFRREYLSLVTKDIFHHLHQTLLVLQEITDEHYRPYLLFSRKVAFIKVTGRGKDAESFKSITLNKITLNFNHNLEFMELILDQK